MASVERRSEQARIHRKLEVDVSTLTALFLPAPKKDYVQLKASLNSFKHHLDQYTTNGREWKKDPTTLMLLESRVFQGMGDLLMEVVLVVSSATRGVDVQNEHNVTSIILSILGNFFSTGGSKKSQKGEDWEMRLLDVLERVLCCDILVSDVEILNRSLRLGANIVKKILDLRFGSGTGLLRSILGVIPKLDKIPKLDAGNCQGVSKVLTSFLRCIRALLSKNEVKVKINSLRGIQLIMTPLSWTTNIMTPSIQLEVLKITQILVSGRLSSLPKEELTRVHIIPNVMCIASLDSKAGLEIAETLINGYWNSAPNTEIYAVTVAIIRNFLYNQGMFSIILNCGILKIINLKVETYNVASDLECHLDLLRTLFEMNQIHRGLTLYFAPHAAELCGSLVKVLRMTELLQYHPLIWSMYVQLPPSLFPFLVKEGIVEEIKKSLHENTGIVSYEDVHRRLNQFALLSPAISTSMNQAFRRLTGDADNGNPETAIKHCGTNIIVNPTNLDHYTPERCQNRMEYSSNESISETPPSAKHARLDTTARKIPMPSLGDNSSVTDIQMFQKTLIVVKQLLPISETRIEIASLMPTFLCILFEIGYFTDITCRFSFNKHKGTFRRLIDTPIMNSQTDFIVFIDLNFIISNLCHDEELFPMFIAQDVPSLLLKMCWTCPIGMELKDNLDNFLDIMTGLNGLRESRLARAFKSSSSLAEQLRAVICGPILSREVSRINRWFEPYSKYLIETLENKAIQGDEQLIENILLSLLKIGEGIDLNWGRLRENTEEPHLCQVTSWCVIENGSTEPSVCLIMEGGAELHVKAEPLMKASEVFEAMLCGHFLEAKERRVQIPHFTREAVLAYLCQIIPDEGPRRVPMDDNAHAQHSVDTLFQILALAHRYMTAEVYMAAMNTIIGKHVSGSSFMEVYTTALEYPDFQCDIIPSFDLTPRTMLILYFLTTNEIQVLVKVAILKELYAYNFEDISNDLSKVFSSCRQIGNHNWQLPVARARTPPVFPSAQCQNSESPKRSLSSLKK